MRPLTKNAVNGTYVKVLPIDGIFVECSTRHPSDEKLEEWYYPSRAFSCHRHICTALTRNWVHPGYFYVETKPDPF